MRGNLPLPLRVGSLCALRGDACRGMGRSTWVQEERVLVLVRQVRYGALFIRRFVDCV